MDREPLERRIRGYGLAAVVQRISPEVEPGMLPRQVNRTAFCDTRERLGANAVIHGLRNRGRR